MCDDGFHLRAYRNHRNLQRQMVKMEFDMASSEKHVKGCILIECDLDIASYL